MRTLAWAFSYEVPSSVERCAIDPSSFKSDRCEFRSQGVCDLAYACEIHRPTVDVDELLEQSNRLVLTRLQGRYEMRFMRGRLGKARSAEQTIQRERNKLAHATSTFGSHRV